MANTPQYLVLLLRGRPAISSRPDFGLVSKRTKIEPIKGEGPRAKAFDAVMEEWAELTIALNCLNRSMGLRDLYPFVLSKPVGAKLQFISEVIAG